MKVAALVILSAASLLFTNAEPVQSCEPRVQAILFDGHSLVLGGLAPVRQAVERELRRLGVQPTWMKDGDPGEEGFVVRVVLLPHAAAGDRGRDGETLGAVHWERDSASSVFIFYPAVKKVLGMPADTTSILHRPPGGIWTKGLSRIIVHEILHVLLPGRPHDPSGLFAPNLTQGDLLGPELALDTETLSSLVARLCQASSLGDAGPSLGLPESSRWR